MSKAVVIITKQDIEKAVLTFFRDQIRPGYDREFSDTFLSFSNKDGNIGYFECSIEFEVGKPEDIAKEEPTDD